MLCEPANLQRRVQKIPVCKGEKSYRYTVPYVRMVPVVKSKAPASFVPCLLLKNSAKMMPFSPFLLLTFLACKSTSFRLNSVNILASGTFHRKKCKLIISSAISSPFPAEDNFPTTNDLDRDVTKSNDSHRAISSRQSDDKPSDQAPCFNENQQRRLETTAFGDRDDGGLGEYNPAERLPGRRQQVLVGEPQKKAEKEYSVSSILKELVAIQEQGPQKYCVLGTRHCSYLHQRIIELLYVEIFVTSSFFSIANFTLFLFDEANLFRGLLADLN